jgi:ADP-dependent NAD(P)H-hydrate dehydratase / NAD(P)H-hydrate epimerase
MRIGAGLVSVATSKAAFYINAAQLTSIMVSPYDGAGGLAEIFRADPRRNALLIGPGAGATPETRENVAAALSSDAVAVVDAEGLTAFADDPAELFSLIQSRGAATILTPHKGEFDRLFPELDNAESKLEQTKRAAEISGAVVVFKGPDTVVSAPDGLSAITEDAPPWLATAGTGDVLAGMITGLFAQSMSPFYAAVAGVWMHAELARTFGPGLIAEDMAEMMPPLLQRLNKMTKLF